jgi:hypothetical protein
LRRLETGGIRVAALRYSAAYVPRHIDAGRMRRPTPPHPSLPRRASISSGSGTFLPIRIQLNPPSNHNHAAVGIEPKIVCARHSSRPMEITYPPSAQLMRLVLWSVIACAFSLLPVTSFVLLSAHLNPPIPAAAPSAQQKLWPRFDAEYQKHACQTRISTRASERRQTISTELQTAYDTFCTCVGNVIVLSELEHQEQQRQLVAARIKEQSTLIEQGLGHFGEKMTRLQYKKDSDALSRLNQRQRQQAIETHCAAPLRRELSKQFKR